MDGDLTASSTASFEHWIHIDFKEIIDFDWTEMEVYWYLGTCVQGILMQVCIQRVLRNSCQCTLAYWNFDFPIWAPLK